MMLVTLQQASDHLRRDTNADDADLTLKIHGASAVVLAYVTESPYQPMLDESGQPVLNEAGAPVYEQDEGGEPVVRPEVQNATLLMVGFLYKDRDEDADKQWERGYPPAPVASLLQHLRTPGLA